MADVTISDLDPKPIPLGTDEIELQATGDGASAKATLDNAVGAGAKLLAISTTIAKTAVGVFVYDTALDSDGGAWRQRMQDRSWENETLDTATRGSRREFPAVAVLVLEADTLTIYDGDDPALPMWRVIDLSGLTLIALAALNGKIAIATTTGVAIDDYIGDDLADTTLEYTTSTSPAIVNNTCNDIAITALPTTPIDANTRLPVPTIAVVTDSGASVITDAGVVWDITLGSALTGIDFSEDYRIWVHSGSTLSTGPIPTADIAYGSWRDASYGGVGSDLLLNVGSVITLSAGAVGNNAAANIIDEDVDTPANGMIAYVTKDYNTGWMQGDTELALCDGLTDRSISSTVVTDNGTAVIADAAANAEQQKITTSGGTLTATVTTGGAIYGWEFVGGEWIFRADTGWVGVAEAAGTLTVDDATTFAMLRYINGAGPSAAQYAKIEADEQGILSENAGCLLFGNSNTVAALAHDPVTKELHVGTGAGRSVFQGLVRGSNDTDAIATAISVSNRFVMEE